MNARFVGIVDHEGHVAYRVRARLRAPRGYSLVTLAFERRPGDGTAWRRLRTLAELEARADLADMLENPWRERRTVHEPLSDDAKFRRLDGPKQDALRLLWATLPVFCVVGPPGVGKTMLATEVLRRKFASERAARVLLSAQGQ